MSRSIALLPCRAPPRCDLLVVCPRFDSAGSCDKTFVWQPPLTVTLGVLQAGIGSRSTLLGGGLHWAEKLAGFLFHGPGWTGRHDNSFAWELRRFILTSK